MACDYKVCEDALQQRTRALSEAPLCVVGVSDRSLSGMIGGGVKEEYKHLHKKQNFLC